MPWSTTADPALLNPDTGFAQLLSLYQEHHPDGSLEMLRRAYRLAVEAHAGQIRKSGEDYINHPVAVTNILASYGLDEPTLVAGLLHDVVEDTPHSLEDIEQEFGSEIASLIDGVTKLDYISYTTRAQAQAATIRKMLVATAQDMRVLVIKLADRLHNIRTIHALREPKQRSVAQETLEVFAPLAHRLGVQEIKHELEDRSFAVLHPGPSADIRKRMSQRAPERDKLIARMIGEVLGLLDQARIKADLTGRPKHHYSIYRKMVESGKEFEEIHDLIGLRIITDSVADCYAVLGLVHSHWLPVSGRFKDYIAMPKLNLYQSLHTTVIGTDRKPTEIQIRTGEMHHLAESGIAAHWRYKEGSAAPEQDWVADLRRIQEDTSDPEEFLDNLKLDLYQEEVFVLTPTGEVKILPRGSTPVDFAYAVHTEVGDSCVGARINGRLSPLPTALESGDIVEIITSKSPDASPSRDWLSFLRTGKARSKVKAFFHRERRQEDIARGKEQLLASLRKEGLGLSANQRDKLLAEVAEGIGKRDLESLWLAIGEGSLSPGVVVTRLVRLLHPEETEPPEEHPPAPLPTRTGIGPEVFVEGLDDMMVHLARCCGPVPGEDILGFVTVGRGVSVHRSDCTNLGDLWDRRERMVEVSWNPTQIGRFAVWVQVEALDRTKLLRDVTAAISDLGGNITASSSSVSPDRVAVLRYEVELSDPGAVPRLIADLRGVEGVFSAYRIMAETVAV